MAGAIRLAAGDALDGVFQFLGGSVLQQEALRAGLYRALKQRRVVEGGHEDDGRVVAACAQRAHDLDAGAAWHANVGHDHVDACSLQSCEQQLAVFGFDRHFEPAQVLEQGAQAVTDERLIVG